MTDVLCLVKDNIGDVLMRYVAIAFILTVTVLSGSGGGAGGSAGGAGGGSTGGGGADVRVAQY